MSKNVLGEDLVPCNNQLRTAQIRLEQNRFKQTRHT